MSIAFQIKTTKWALLIPAVVYGKRKPRVGRCVSSALKRVGQLANRPININNNIKINNKVNAILKKPTSRTLCLLSRSRSVLASDSKLGRWSALSRQHSSMMPYLQSTPGRSLHKWQRLINPQWDASVLHVQQQTVSWFLLLICVDNQVVVPHSQWKRIFCLMILEGLHFLLHDQVCCSAQCVVGLQFAVQVGRLGHPVTLLQQIRQFAPVDPWVRTPAWRNKSKKRKNYQLPRNPNQQLHPGIHWTKSKPSLTWRTPRGHL